jgi:hypothetical protein
MTAISFGLYLIFMYAGRFCKYMGWTRLEEQLYLIAFPCLAATALGVGVWLWRVAP